MKTLFLFIGIIALPWQFLCCKARTNHNSSEVESVPKSSPKNEEYEQAIPALCFKSFKSGVKQLIRLTPVTYLAKGDSFGNACLAHKFLVKLNNGKCVELEICKQDHTDFTITDNSKNRYDCDDL